MSVKFAADWEYRSPLVNAMNAAWLGLFAGLVGAGTAAAIGRRHLLAFVLPAAVAVGRAAALKVALTGTSLVVRNPLRTLVIPISDGPIVEATGTVSGWGGRVVWLRTARRRHRKRIWALGGDDASDVADALNMLIDERRRP